MCGDMRSPWDMDVYCITSPVSGTVLCVNPTLYNKWTKAEDEYLFFILFSKKERQKRRKKKERKRERERERRTRRRKKKDSNVHDVRRGGNTNTFLFTCS